MLALVAGMMVAVGVPSVGGPAVGLAAGPNPDQVDPELPSLELQAGDFVPAAGDRLPLPPELSGPDVAAGARADWIVQFEGPVRQEWKDAVIAVGGELFGYLPDFAFKWGCVGVD